MKNLFFSSFIVLCSLSASTQITFEKSYGTYTDNGSYSMAICPDSGYVLAGFTVNSVGNQDLYLVKTNKFGILDWTSTIAYSSSYEELYSIKTTFDGGFIVAGRRNIDSFDYSLLIKYDSNGDTVWAKALTFENDEEIANAVVQTPDGGFVYCGQTILHKKDGRPFEDSFIAKVDGNGNLLWRRITGPDGDNTFRDILLCSDNGFIICGAYQPIAEPGTQSLLIKTDSSGNQQWYKTYGELHITANSVSVKELPEGGYILCGSYFPSVYILPGSGDYYLVKTDPAGNLIWSKTYDRGFTDIGTSVDITPEEDGFIICGYTKDEIYGPDDVYLIRTDLEGDTLWTKIYGTADGWDNVFSVLSTSDNGFAVGGMTDSFGYGMYDVYLIKTNHKGLVTGLADFPEDQVKFRIFPVPLATNSVIEFDLLKSANIILGIYNQLGQVVDMPLDKTLPAGTHRISWNTGEIPAGIYFYKLAVSGSKTITTGKVVKIN